MGKSFLCRALLCFSLVATTAQALPATGTSSVKVNLGPDWKVLNTRDENKIATIIFYTRNTNTPAPEELIETHAVIPFGAKNFLFHNLYTPVHDVLGKHHCKIDDMSFPVVAGSPQRYGFIWQCKKNQSSGFMLFSAGDSTTCYSIAYKKLGAYPVTAAARNNMLKLMKSIQICYDQTNCFSTL
jgi:hypothetical protein